MPFAYPSRAHSRKHGPSGYTDYTSFKPWLRDEFRFRCVYCLERERWYPSGHAAFAVDHVRPQGNPEFASLVCDYKNLVYTFYSEEDACYVADIPDLRFCSALGATPEEAIREVLQAKTA